MEQESTGLRYCYYLFTWCRSSSSYLSYTAP